MVVILQAVFSGLALGGIYALVALGFNITHNTTKTFNFGQGEFLVAGAFVAVSGVLLFAGKGLTDSLLPEDVTLVSYGASLVVSVLVLGVLGVLLYFTAVRPFVGRPGLAWVMSTIGFGIMIIVLLVRPNGILGQRRAVHCWSCSPRSARGAPS